jgi:hypothetical protein
MAAKKAAAKRGAKKKAAARKPSAKRGAKKKAPARKRAAKKRAAASASATAAAKPTPKPAARSAASAPAATPARNRGLLIGAAVLAVLAAIALAVVLIDSGGDESGGVSDAAAPALDQVDSAMQDVFDTFQLPAFRRFDPAQTPYGKFRDEVLGPRKAMLASFDAEERDYTTALNAIKTASGVLEENANDLTSAGDASEDAKSYVDDARAFLDEYDQDVHLLAAWQHLDRVAEESYVGGDTADDSVDAARAAVMREVSRLEGIAQQHAKLEATADLQELAAAQRALNALRLQQQKELLATIDAIGSGSGAISRADIRIDAAAEVRRLQAAYTALQEHSELSRSIAGLMDQADALASELD